MMSLETEEGARRFARLIAEEVVGALRGAAVAPPREYLTLQEAGALLGIKSYNLGKRIAEGRFGAEQGVRLLGGRIYLHWPTFQARGLRPYKTRVLTRKREQARD